MSTVQDNDIRAFEQMVQVQAHRFVGVGGAEYDDLVQEGLVFVWLSLSKGITPSADLVSKRMISWIRFINKQNPIPYNELLPMEADG
jgi:hypothetical protein